MIEHRTLPHRNYRQVGLGIGLIVGFVLLGFYWQALAMNKLHSLHSYIGWLTLENLKQAIAGLKYEVLRSPIFYGATIGILFLEWCFPAKPNQPLLSVGLWEDFLWLSSTYFFKFFLFKPYLNFLGWFHTVVLHGFSLHLPDRLALPELMILALSILLADFLGWFSHVLAHKIALIWRFHETHHSQRQLNFLTDMRFHFGSVLFDYPIVVLPSLILAVPLPYTGYYLLFRIWYARLYHANIRSSFGVFKYILVTPQSHRIHHSIEPHHYDRNFGIVFSIWDYLFRTQYRRYREYPDTGLVDSPYPLTEHASGLALLKIHWAQWLYPFGFTAPTVRSKV